MVQLCMSIGSVVVELGGDLWCRVGYGWGSDLFQIWHSCGVQLCVWPQFMWFSVGSALVQVCVAAWFTGSGEVLIWLSFASVGRSIHGVWFSIGGVVWFSYDLPFYHMWCMCGSYCCGVILFGDLVQ